MALPGLVSRCPEGSHSPGMASRDLPAFPKAAQGSSSTTGGGLPSPRPPSRAGPPAPPGLPESLLPSRVPDLQLHRFAADGHHLRPEFHPDGVVGVLLDCRAPRGTRGRRVTRGGPRQARDLEGAAAQRATAPWLRRSQRNRKAPPAAQQRPARASAARGLPESTGLFPPVPSQPRAEAVPPAPPPATHICSR